MDDEVNEKINYSCCLSKSCEGCGTHNSVANKGIFYGQSKHKMQLVDWGGGGGGGGGRGEAVSTPVGPGQSPVAGPGGATPPEALRL